MPWTARADSSQALRGGEAAGQQGGREQHQPGDEHATAEQVPGAAAEQQQLAEGQREPVEADRVTAATWPITDCLRRVDGARRRARRAWWARRSCSAFACISLMWSAASCRMMTGCGTNL